MAKENKEKSKTEEVLEREYTIPLRREWIKAPRYKRAKKAIRAIREFIARHMKVYDRDLNKIKVDRYLNEEIWFRGIKKPPIRIKVKAIKDKEGIVRVELAEMPEKLKYKKAREERRETKGKEVSDKKKKEKKEEKVDEEAKEEEKKEKEETEEKKDAVVEAGKEMEKQQAKKMKHQSKEKFNQPKHQFRKALKK